MIKGWTDVKALFSGIGMAAVAGLLMGAAMKPNLDAGDRPAGPQIFTGWSAARSTGPFDDGAASFAPYRGQLPGYVLGADWQKEAAPIEVAYQPAPAPDYYERAVSERSSYPEVKYQDPPREAPVYPSMSGGVAHSAEQHGKDAVDARETTPSPDADLPRANLDEQAPPEATGDTSRVRR